ncbi:MAG: carbohydrate ABC transporter permease [Lachnospirales bacterium]
MKENKIKNSFSDYVFDLASIIFCIAILIVVLYPLYFVIIASFSDPNAVSTGQTLLFPKGITLDGYKELLNHKNIWIGYRNTIFYTLIGTFISLSVNISAAYALSRKDLVGRKYIAIFYVFTMFFNGGLIPTFMTIQQFGLYDTFWVMILPFSVFVYDIVVARTFFQTSIPDELLDAAQVDGCGNLRFFLTMVLPLAKPILAVLGLWAAVGIWNSYFNALIYLRNSELFPLQLVLRNILITNQMQSSLGTGEAAQLALRTANIMKYAVIVISTVPIMCVYPFTQKHFNKGFMSGALKG